MHASTPLRYAGQKALVATPWAALILAAVLSIGIWQAAEAILGRFTHPAHLEMVNAAHKMQAAIQVARAQRMRLDLMQPTADPNRTGLIGSEFTEITTSLGDPAAKRTATNPDLAAALVRRIDELSLPGGSPVMVLVSGSFVGGNIAAIVAVEALGLKPMVIASLGASMHGATDPMLTWLDIEAELHDRGIIAARSMAALIGSGSGIGRGMSDDGLAALQAAASRNSVPLIVEGDIRTLLERIDALVRAASGGAPRLLVNSGGSVAALGTCSDGDRIPPVVVGRQLACTDGEPGIIVRSAAEGIPVIHLLNMRGLAADWGLPFDPVPLPVVGNNRAVYGMMPE